jgi:hypothetical protein
MRRLILFALAPVAAVVLVPTVAVADSATHTYLLVMEEPNFDGFLRHRPARTAEHLGAADRRCHAQRPRHHQLHHSAGGDNRYIQIS